MRRQRLPSWSKALPASVGLRHDDFGVWAGRYIGFEHPRNRGSAVSAVGIETGGFGGGGFLDCGGLDVVLLNVDSV